MYLLKTLWFTANLRLKIKRIVYDHLQILSRSVYTRTILFLGDVAEAVRHARTINSQIRQASVMDSAELHTFAKHLHVPYELLKKTAEMKRLPVVNFAAGGLGE